MNNQNLIQSAQNILIVDDIQANLQVLGHILKREGYIVRLVLSGELALQEAENEIPDLILLDIMMPEMDGYQVCKLLKENPILAEIPVIFISALTDTQDIVKAFKVGGIDYITKPFQGEEVRARVATHLKICRQSKELLRLNADKDRFMAILAHDLRNPFHTLIGLSEMLIENVRQSDLVRVENFAVLINKSAQNTYYLLEDLLSWAQSQAGKIPFEPLKISFSDICISIISSLKNSANNKNITVNYYAPEEIFVFADLNMLKTILRNLISNAIKFTNFWGRISVFAHKSDVEVAISVSDSGVGMNQERLADLFDARKVYSSPGTADEKGTGLGLMLCKDFVEKHGGKIWVISDEGKGSEFKFTMPLNSLE